jgi:hypothetical protein
MTVGTWVTGGDRIGLKDYQEEGVGGLNTVPQVPAQYQLSLFEHLLFYMYTYPYIYIQYDMLTLYMVGKDLL